MYKTSQIVQNQPLAKTVETAPTAWRRPGRGAGDSRVRSSWECRVTPST